MTSLYLDANATHGPLLQVIQGVTDVCANCWNPSAVHSNGQSARALIEAARDQIREALDARGARLIFTSGATESNNLALEGLLKAQRREHGLDEVVVSVLEHPSVLQCTERLAQQGVRVHRVLPDQDKTVSVQSIIDACSSRTAVVSCMAAHNETGQIFPVEEICRELRSAFPRVRMHCDGVQALGKLPLSFAKLGVDALTISGHKVGALPGVGALVIQPYVSLDPGIVGGSQEVRYRAGTENVLGIWSFGVAAEHVRKLDIQEQISRLRTYRTLFIDLLRGAIPTVEYSFERLPLLPNTVNARFPGVGADDLVVALDLAGLKVSTGSACSSGKQEPSPALLHLGLSEAAARESIRFSFLPTITEHEIRQAVSILIECLKRTIRHTSQANFVHNEGRMHGTVSS
jgi:cysteine desulfurase